jgi:crotonobetainyl-CoA:carnitine CoA-transferase CaiB-like acyl-CoA transferase
MEGTERPGSGDQSRTWGPPFLGDESAYYLAVNRNKRSLTLNFARAAGQEILHRLVDRADVFITNLPKQSSLEKYQIDYGTLRARNKGIIYAAISGYGHSGPRSGQPGYDIIAQGESGTMHLTGPPEGGPTRFPTPIADMTAGLFSLIGILSALHARNASGEGQFVDVSLLESQMTWLENYAGEYFASGEEPPKRGNTHPQVVPYEPMQGSDGEWFILGVGSDNLWNKFCDLVDLGDVRDDPRFHTNAERVRNREELLPIVRQAMQVHTAEEWLDLLTQAGIPSGPIRNVSAAMADPQVAARNVIVELEHPAFGLVKSLATPVHLSGTALSYRRYPPRLGENNDEILRELGYDSKQVESFRSEGII